MRPCVRQAPAARTEGVETDPDAIRRSPAAPGHGRRIPSDLRSTEYRELLPCVAGDIRRPVILAR
jgi:hypothetical protein